MVRLSSRPYHCLAVNTCCDVPKPGQYRQSQRSKQTDKQKRQRYELTHSHASSHRVAPASEMVLECGCSRTSSSDNASIVRRRSISARRDPPPIYQTSHRAAASSSRPLYGRSTSFKRKRSGPDLRNISAPLRDTLVRTAYVQQVTHL